MNKKILTILILLIGILVALSFAQYRSSDSSRQEKIAAPDFSLDDIEGKPFKLSNQKGNPVIMFFGATWCPACRGEMSSYKALYDKYAKSGLKFLYIDLNESTRKVASFAKENSFPFVVLLDLDGSVASNYGIIGVPTIILVDRQGNIIGAGHRTSDLPVDDLFSAKKIN